MALGFAIFLLCLVAHGADAAFAQAAGIAEHETRRFASILFLFGFLVLPAFIVIAPIFAAVALVIAGFHVMRSIDSGSWSLPWWVLPVLIATPVFIVALYGRNEILPLLIWPCCLLGLLIWHVIERVLGKGGFTWEGFQRRSLPARAGIVIAASWIVYKAVTGIRMSILLASVWVDPPDMGSPPYNVLNQREMTLYTNLALKQFPDAQSCLLPGADATDRADLVRMDWDRIQSATEAKICMFRLLASLGGLAYSEAFFEAQGFRMAESEPFVHSDGSVRVSASWSIRERGPKFPTKGVTRYLYAVPYSMVVNATYEPDGTSLRHVVISFNTL